MLGAAIVCPDHELSTELQRLLAVSGNVAVLRVLEHYPSQLELVRALRANAPEVIFLSTESAAGFQEAVRCLETHAPNLQVVAVGRDTTPNHLLFLMNAGMREYLPFPFQQDQFEGLVARVQSKLLRTTNVVEATDLLYSFLPAKAGVGTTTLSVSAAIALAETHGISTLLTDLDLNSGMVRFMLKLDSTYCVTDAVDRAAELDENLWPQLVSTQGKLDILHAGNMNPGHRLELHLLRQMLGFVRRNYRVILADHSGNMEKYSLEVLHESKRIFLVCTPEIPSLHLALEKYRLLSRLDLGGRVSLLLNRAHRRAVLTQQEIEKLLGLPVLASFPNDYAGVHTALTEGKRVKPSSPLGKQINALAASLAEGAQHPLDPPESPRRRFRDFFNRPNNAPERLAITAGDPVAK